VTNVKVAYREQSKSVTSEVVVESDELSGEDVEREAAKLFRTAFNKSKNWTVNEK